MLTQYTLKIPHGVYSGRGALDHAKEIMGEYATKVTVFNDQGVIGAGLLEKPLSLIKEAGVEYSALDGLLAEPDCDRAQAVINRFRAERSDFIVAVDGESIMNIAELASALAIDVYMVKDLLGNLGLTGKYVPTLMVPTIAGIGSGTTLNSIVAAPEEELKVGIVNDAMIAGYVILDEKMIRHLPKKATTTTEVDILAHGIECYTSNKANPFSDTFVLETLSPIFNHTERVRNDLNALDIKNVMLIATFYAGTAITTSGTTAVHALPYPLRGKYHIPHSVSNVMLLTSVMKFNEPACRGRLAAVYDRVVKGGQESGLPPGEKSVWITRRLDETVKYLEIPDSLKEYGVEDEGLDVLVEAGMDVKRLLVNDMQEVIAEDARRPHLEIMR